MIQPTIIINQKRQFFARITGGTGPAQAFDELIRQLRARGIDEQTLANFAVRYFKIHLRASNSLTTDIEKYAWAIMQNTQPNTNQGGRCGPAGCIFDHDGWIFFGAI